MLLKTMREIGLIDGFGHHFENDHLIVHFTKVFIGLECGFFMGQRNPEYTEKGTEAVLRGVRELTEKGEPNRYFTPWSIADRSRLEPLLPRLVNGLRKYDRPTEKDVHEFMETHVKSGSVSMVLFNSSRIYRANLHS